MSHLPTPTELMVNKKVVVNLIVKVGNNNSSSHNLLAKVRNNNSSIHKKENVIEQLNYTQCKLKLYRDKPRIRDLLSFVPGQKVTLQYQSSSL